MSKVSKLIKMIVYDRRRLVLAIVARIVKIGAFNHMEDSRYLGVLFYLHFGRRINWVNPQTYNEKLQWLKLYDRRPEYSIMVDKYKVREYVAEKIGAEHLIPSMGVWESADEIDFEKLPNRFVLKCNHNSGFGFFICKDKSKLHIQSVRKILSKGLKQDFFFTGREWPYKDVPRRIIAEEFMTDDKGELWDYKFYCFDGEPKIALVVTDRFESPGFSKFDYFDMEWNHLAFSQGGANSSKDIEKPGSFKQMIAISKALSKGIPHVRVDLYEIHGQVYFGELTLYDSSGFAAFNPEKWDYTFGSWINLP